jgi:hypothetical protein
MWRGDRNGKCPKRPYSKKIAQTLRNKSLNHGRIVRIYACTSCPYWHLTHQSRERISLDLMKQKMGRENFKSKSRQIQRSNLREEIEI